MNNDYLIYELENFDLQSGQSLPNAKLAYKTYGKLNEAKNNVVVLPTFYTGSHMRNEGFFGAGRAIDPDKHFIVSVNLFGNGISSSPSNTPNKDTPKNDTPPLFMSFDKTHSSGSRRDAPTLFRQGSADNIRFPNITLFDNIRAQHQLLTEELEVKEIALVTGWSMAGCQAYQWAAQYPKMVKAILPFCASAKTSEHNIVFLEGIKAALQADAVYANGDYKTPPIKGLKAFGRIYAGWAFSQTFYRKQMYKLKGFDSAEELLQDWEQDHLDWDANDLLCKIWTWQNSDISQQEPYNGDFTAALNAIQAKTIVIVCDDDLYFRVEDNQLEVEQIKNGELRVFSSPWGHCVASPGNEPKFEQFLDQSIAELLN